MMDAMTATHTAATEADLPRLAKKRFLHEAAEHVQIGRAHV